MVTRRGTEAAVLVPVQDWRRLQQATRPTLKAVLLAAAPRLEIPLPSRRRWRRRRPSVLR